MVLENDRAFFGEAFQFCGGGGATFDGDVVLNEDAVVKDGEAAGGDGAVGGFFWCMKDDVVGLPLAGFARGVYERSSQALAPRARPRKPASR